MIDYSDWDTLLRHYVDLQGRVEYRTWQVEQPRAIARWIDTLPLSLDPQTLSREEQLALWLNLYNAFTIAAILERYPILSIQPQILGLPNWPGFLWFFYRRSHLAFGQRYSLAQIENQMLRQQFQDPRIHFAIVCASMGCPLLRNEAYRPEIVDQQLEEDADRFINNPDKVNYDASTGTLYCSKIFKWYRPDFLRVAPSIPSYIGKYLDQPLSLAAPAPIAYLNYDWSLNQRIS